MAVWCQALSVQRLGPTFNRVGLALSTTSLIFFSNPNEVNVFTVYRQQKILSKASIHIESTAFTANFKTKNLELIWNARQAGSDSRSSTGRGNLGISFVESFASFDKSANMKMRILFSFHYLHLRASSEKCRVCPCPSQGQGP